MLETTLAEIKSHNPCADGWAKLRKYIGPRKPLSTVVTLEQIVESNGLYDAIWALRACPQSERKARLFACACACRVAHMNRDVRVLRSIETAALYADGLADEDELAAAGAGAAARDAAGAAARDAAWAAAGAGAAARDAARAAAWSAGAARAAGAAGAAAWDAERSWQREEFLRMCRGEGIYAPLEGCTEWQQKYGKEG